ncbi:hypothetical protein QE450_000862 [Paenibacillus sp. SORGH_AS306]|nr:hypothetical protein [Paenibacillus sp. SORGH_AS_0306]MDR6110405.1 hypothetical protein [Paenibacillus sp. SORGH_AS_0338]
MESFLYILFSIFDALAMIFLMFKLYRLPINFYIKEISLLTLVIALFSFLMRMVIHLPLFDLPMQFLIFVFFFRYIIQMKFHYSAFVASSGFILFTNIQLLLYYFFTFTGIMNSSVLTQLSGLSVYLVQISTELFTFLLCWLLWRYSLGFSFILMPPHDFDDSEDYSSRQNKEIIISTVISFITISATVLFLHDGNPSILFILSVISFGIAYYFSKKGDMSW